MKWLNEFVPMDAAPRAFSEAMTMSGSKVEGWEIEGEDIKKVVVGKILSIEKHPDADKLVVCQVDVGSENAPDCHRRDQFKGWGTLSPVALDGSLLPGGVKIKRGKLRGVESCGMLCSLGRAGTDRHDFLMPSRTASCPREDCGLGQDIQSAIGLNDTKVEFEITSNRPDCFSVIGLAREAAATFDKPSPAHARGQGRTRDAAPL